MKQFFFLFPYLSAPPPTEFSAAPTSIAVLEQVRSCLRLVCTDTTGMPPCPRFSSISGAARCHWTMYCLSRSREYPVKWGACLGAVDDGLAVLNAAGDANCCRPCGALAGRLRPWQLGNEMGRPMGSVRCIPREARKEAGARRRGGGWRPRSWVARGRNQHCFPGQRDRERWLGEILI